MSKSALLSHTKLDFDDSTTALYKEKLAIQKKRKLIDITKNLSHLEYYEIFNILESSNSQYSDNNNGIFVNLHNVSDEIIDKIFDLYLNSHLYYY